MSKLLCKKKRILMVAVVLIALCVGAGCVKAGTSESEEESKTTTAKAAKVTVENTLSTEGEVVSSLEEDLKPHTGYYLKKIKVEAGTAVKEGETILTYTNGKKMKAPYDLVVESWSLPKKGKQLTSSHYITVSGMDVLAMEISVAEDQVAKVKAGDKATIKISAADKTYEGEVASVSEVGTYSDSGSTFTAKVTFKNDGNVKIGMTGTVSITLEKAENVIAVPVSAVSQHRGKKVVTVQKNDDTTEQVEVETGVENDAFVEIKSGLAEGDTVVIPVSEDSSDSRFGGMPGGMSGGMPGGDAPGGMPGGTSDNHSGHMPGGTSGNTPGGTSGGGSPNGNGGSGSAGNSGQ